MKISPVIAKPSKPTVNCLDNRNTAFGNEKSKANLLFLVLPADKIKGSLLSKKLFFSSDYINDNNYKKFFPDFDFKRPVTVVEDNNNFDDPEARIIKVTQDWIKEPIWGVPGKFLVVIKRKVSELQLSDVISLTGFRQSKIENRKLLNPPAVIKYKTSELQLENTINPIDSDLLKVYYPFNPFYVNFLI